MVNEINSAFVALVMGVFVIAFIFAFALYLLFEKVKKRDNDSPDYIV